VWLSKGLPGKLRLPTTKPSPSVVTTLISQPNSYRTSALPLEIQSTSGSCRAQILSSAWVAGAGHARRGQAWQ
jgi:hypothetical protein